MPLIAKNKGGDIKPVEAGMHRAICYGVVDIGTHQGGHFTARRKVVFLWELPELRGDFERDGKKINLPRGLNSRYTLSLSPKSNLRPMLVGWRGREFTEDELKGFDVFNVAGHSALLNIIHETRDGNTYANVKTVNPMPKDKGQDGKLRIPKPKPENPLVTFSIDEYDGKGLPPGIPDWIRELIMSSDEYLTRFGGNNNTPGGGQGTDTHTELDEDVPF